MIKKIAHGLTRKPKLVALIAVLLLIPSALGYIGTRVNYDILSYLPEDLDSVRGERLLEDPFHMAATSMLIVEGMPAAYTNDLINEIKEVPGVSSAIWLSNAVGIQIPTDFIPAALRDMFFAGDSTMMIIQYEKSGAAEETMQAIDDVRSLCNEKCFLAGFSVVIKDTKDLVDQELPIYVGLAVLLSLVAMSLTMESMVLPFVFLLSIGMAIVYNFGTNIFLGEISYITQAIAAVLQLGVTMDYSIFLYHRYREERLLHEEPRDAMAEAIVAAFTSLSGSSLTTIAGFLALCFMQLTLGRDIGLVMAKGVVLGVATVVLVLPALLLIFDEKIEKHKHRTLIPNFEKMNSFIIRHRQVFVAVFLLLFLPAVYAQSHTAVYYKLDEALPQDMDSIIANNKLKNDYDMAASHFVLLRDDLSSTEMNQLETSVKDVEGITSVLSYHAMLGSGIPDFFIPEALRDMLKQGGWQMMMVNSEYPAASDQVSVQLEELERIIKSYDPEALITGEAVLTDDLIDTSAVDFKVTNYISLAAIFLIIMVVFRSLSMPLVLVAAIELAIFINQGIPYFTGTVIPFVSPKNVIYVAPPTVRKIHNILRSAFHQAVKWELMEKNPAMYATVPKSEAKKREIWDAPTLFHALEVCEDERLKLAINLAFACSLRIGELLGLTWDCVDISPESIAAGKAYVYVNKELQRVDKSVMKVLGKKDVLRVFPELRESNKTVLVLKKPKTATSTRKIFLPKTVAEMLVEWKREQDFTKEALGNEYADFDLVMANGLGMPTEQSRITALFAELIEKNDLPKVVFHSLRHSSITYKLKLNGGDIKSVQGDSGHAQAQMVTDQYSHILDDVRKNNAALFEKAFYSGKGSDSIESPAETGSEAKAATSGVDPDLLAKILSNPEMAALLTSLAKSLN